MEVLGIKIVRRCGHTAAGWAARLVAAKARHHASRERVLEHEMAGSQREYELLRDQVDIGRGEKRRLLRFTNGVLIERGGRRLHTGIDHRATRERSQIAEAARGEVCGAFIGACLSDGMDHVLRNYESDA